MWSLTHVSRQGAMLGGDARETATQGHRPTMSVVGGWGLMMTTPRDLEDEKRRSPQGPEDGRC